MKNPFDDDDDEEKLSSLANPFDDEDDCSPVNVSQPKATYSPLALNSDSAVQSSNTAQSPRGRHKFQEIMRTVDRKMKKRGVGHCVVSVDESNENKIIRFLLSERVFGYPHSDGTWSSNYKHYVMNNHPGLSLILSHPLHPYTKKSRFVVFVCLLLFAVTLSFVFWDTNYAPQVSQF